MGRFVGSFMDDNELDRPDLNKCPDCECFFPQDNCPICGKVCPEEMRAGNRKKVKAKKPRNGRSKTVQYFDWYHRWWFIILMLVVFPIVGFILLVGSPHKKSLKITVIVIAIVYTIVSSFGIGNLAGSLKSLLDPPVNTSIEYDEYVAKCKGVSGDAFYRNPDEYKNEYVKLFELRVEERFSGYEAVFNRVKQNDYYLCTYTKEGLKYEIIVRDCTTSGKEFYSPGESIWVCGEGEGYVTLNCTDGKSRSSACINAAYIFLEVQE